MDDSKREAKRGGETADSAAKGLTVVEHGTKESAREAEGVW
jgi:hypothetical protein